MNGVSVNERVSLGFLQMSATALIMLVRTITFEVLNHGNSGHITGNDPLLFHRFSTSPFDSDFTTMEFILVHLVFSQETP